jgi:hypothetical protein
MGIIEDGDPTGSLNLEQIDKKASPSYGINHKYLSIGISAELW